MPAGKMTLAHGRSQSGGYHYFLSLSARQLQRFVRQRRDTERRARQLERAQDEWLRIDPPLDQRMELDRSWSCPRRNYLGSPSRSVSSNAHGPARGAHQSIPGRRAHASSSLMMRPDPGAA